MGLLTEFEHKKDILSVENLLHIPIDLLPDRSLTANASSNTNNSNSSSNSKIINYQRACISKFSSKTDSSGLNDWQKLKMKGIKTTSSTKIGAIVSYYGKRDYYVDQSCTILLNMLNWSSEEKKLWSDFDQERNAFVYRQGNAFEDIIPEFFKKKFSDYCIKNWNVDDTGLFLGEYNNKVYNIYCRPDYLLYKLDKNNKLTEGIIVEVKSSSSSTKRLENYKYQLSLQGLLIQYFYPEVPFKYCLLFNDRMIEYSLEEMQKYQKDIIKYVPMFWEDLRTGNFKKISAQELIDSFSKSSKSRK